LWAGWNLITPATTQAVEKILAAHDLTGYRKYNRFWSRFSNEMKAANPAERPQFR
jgi:hypothetical protein